MLNNKEMKRSTIYVMSFFIMLMVVPIPIIWSSPTNLEVEEKQTLLNLHNLYRAKVSRGEIHKRAPSSDMIVVQWDDRLAEIAQALTKSCKRDNDIKNETSHYLKLNLDHEDLGQLSINEYFSENRHDYLEVVVNSWFNTTTDNYPVAGQCSDGSCLSYTNIIFSNIFLLGCGSFHCKRGRSMACVYASRQSSKADSKLYKKGEPCTLCPQRYNYCLEGSLCALEYHCTERRICYCNVVTTICIKHGVFDLAKCRCQCRPNWYGLNCEKPCDDEEQFCAKHKLTCRNSTDRHTKYNNCCRNLCNKSHNSGYIHNKDSIKVSIPHNKRSRFQIGVQMDSACIDTKMECKTWAENGFCSSKSVTRVCKLSCKICGENSITPKQKLCVDQAMCSSDFYLHCNSLPGIALLCPRLCGRCTMGMSEFNGHFVVRQSLESSSPASISSSTRSITSTSTTSKVNTKMKDMIAKHLEYGMEKLCNESTDRNETCVSIKRANLCNRPDLQSYCPTTCDHPACRSFVTSTSPKTVESELCHYLCCDSPGIPQFCPTKCPALRTTKSILDDSPPFCQTLSCSIRYISETCKKCRDPAICIILDCLHSGVQRLCKNKCVIHITTKSSHTTIKVGDPDFCKTMPCYLPSSEQYCPIKCGKNRFKITRPYFKKSNDPDICENTSCSVPGATRLCPSKCRNVFSTKSPQIMTTDPDFCIFLPCSVIGSQLHCPRKCGSNVDKTDVPLLCQKLSCHLSWVKNVCPSKCGKSTVSTSTDSTVQTTTVLTDASFCSKILCFWPGSSIVCPGKCPSHGLSTASVFIENNDHDFCHLVPCNVPGALSYCPQKCADPPFCTNLACINPWVKSACPIKCDSVLSSSKISPRTISTVSSSPTLWTNGFLTTPSDWSINVTPRTMDHQFCPFIGCDVADLKKMCPIMCATTSRELPDPIICSKVPCSDPLSDIVCPRKCKTGTSNSKTV